MPPQSTVPDADDQGFGLIETFRWSRETGYDYLNEHLARLSGSADHLGFPCRREVVVQRLAAFTAGSLASPARVRLVLSRSGSIEITSTPLNALSATCYRVALAGSRHPSANPWLRHKTTMRDRYEGPLAAAVATVGADEVLFLNEQDEVCEGARTNVFVERGEVLLTPPLDCGVLPGTLRAHLVATGKAQEARLRLSDLVGATAWFMGNSVRGLVPAVMVAG